jgi:class 3 adenylate cyclase
VTSCTACGQENPEGFRFCGACAAPLGAAAEPTREVRKTVTAVFCDVVGSTPLGERLDPEVLRRVLLRYFDEMRAVVESHGGHVVKFIGDAVVGVFGVPQVHEDDALRAVRAAREMRTRLAVLNESLLTEWDVELEARTGISTGEVVVGADDEVLLGDVMNTAARLETAAEPGEILIAAETYSLVRDAIVAQPLELALKGKALPVAAWRLDSVTEGAAGRRRRFDRPLVGRELELRRLEDLFEQAVANSGLQLITIVGEPGIGKSRFVAEFEQRLDAAATPVTRRRGQCLAYGNGIGLSPFAEIVKAQLGIGELDTEDQVRARLTAVVEGMVDAPWLRAQLAPLLGLPGEAAEREEVFAAWVRFLDELAARGPLVLIVEDLHWADTALLAFVEYLAQWSTDVPILVICTARPELFERHMAWAGGLANTTTIALRPLGEDDTLQLARTLLTDRGASVQAAAALVSRCGGNPLYAEEYAALLAERIADDDMIQMPDTVQALIAARIDTLPPHRSTLLQDAAVVGKVFWAGAVTAIGNRDPAAVRADLHELARKQFVRRSRTSTIPGDDEYAFWHDLVHEVAYNQIPRSDRAEAHRRSAKWIEQTAGDRLAERAELLAHHYIQALTLTSTHGSGDPEPLRRAALRHLATAANHAMGLDLDHATQLAQQALEIATGEDRERAPLLCLLGTAHVLAGEYDHARTALLGARAAAERTGEVESLSQAYFQQSEMELFAGTQQSFAAVLGEAIDRLSREPPTAGFALVLTNAAFESLRRGEPVACGELLDRAIEMAETVGDRRALAMAINNRGLLRIELGDRASLEDFATALQMFNELGSTYAGMSTTHLGMARLAFDGPADAAPIFADAIAHGDRTRNATYGMDARYFDLDRLAEAGAWDELILAADHLMSWAGSHPSSELGAVGGVGKARVLALRGRAPEAHAAMRGMLDWARGDLDPRAVVPALATAALIECLDGNTDQARSIAENIEPTQINSWAPLAEICRILIACDAAQHAHTLVAHVETGPPRLLNNATSSRAQLAEADRDHATAAALYPNAVKRWRSFANPFELAHALAGHARCLAALDRAGEARLAASEAAATFKRLGVHGPALPLLPN